MDLKTKNQFRLLSVKPAVVPPLDPGFQPISLGNRNYRETLSRSPRACPLSIALERQNGSRSTFHTAVFQPGSGYDVDSSIYVEQLVKFLLWQRGGWKFTMGGPSEIGEFLRTIYSSKGNRSFDVHLMEAIYEKPFVVEITESSQVPASRESSVPLGGHLNGCRIGFDLGASDYKIAAVRDGEPVFSAELHWRPRDEADPEYHIRKIREGLQEAARHLPRVDAIGGSAAGIYIDNKVMVASLFRAVPKGLFEKKVKPMFHHLKQEWGVPVEVANDGDVTALAGAMSLKDSSILGIAMGSSQAAGYLDEKGRITGWLNELAFAPVDYNPQAPVEEWSGDRGCGALYFSQQAVVRLARSAGISLPPTHPAEQLAHVQELHQKGDARVPAIFETIGVYLGYALAQYADMYTYRHLLLLGRVTSGTGGDLILQKAHEVLKTEFPELEHKLLLHLPDEKSKRTGQAVAAASLPMI